MARPQANNVILDYVIPHGNGIIDIPRGLSILNRKSYRAGYVYSVDFVEYIGGAGDSFKIGCLPMSYPLFSAYKLGFEVWKEQRALAIDESGLEPGKWSDFKPYYSLSHVNGALLDYFPRGLSDASLNMSELDRTGGEWNMAEIVRNDHGTATTTTLLVGMLGDDDLAVNYGSLMQAYGDTRAPTLSPDPLTPVVASQSWITRAGPAAAEMSADVIDLIEDENERPPYANQNDPNLPPTYVGNSQSAPGGLLLDVAVTGTTGRPVSLDGGLIPLGFIIFNADMEDEGQVATLRVHCTRGVYKGVAALKMGDFS